MLSLTEYLRGRGNMSFLVADVWMEILLVMLPAGRVLPFEVVG